MAKGAVPTPCAEGVPRHSQPWAKLSVLGTVKSCSAHASAHQCQRHRVFCHQAWGWCSWLRAPSLGGRSRKVTKTRVKGVALAWDLSSTLVPALQSPLGPHQLPILHHPAAAGFPQALTCFPRSPVTISGGFVLVKATPEATGYLPRLGADLHTLINAQPCSAQPIRIPTDQRRRSHSFSPAIVGSVDKLQK